MPTAAVSAPMSKQAAMALYGERRRRTAVIQLDASQMYRRVDVVSVVTQIVGNTKVEAVGQLQNNSTWEVVLRDEPAKNLLVGRDIVVKGKSATVVELQRRLYRMRILRVPTCIPNEYLASKLNNMGMVIKSLMNEINADDGLMSNVRVGTFECKDLDTVHDVIQWQFDGLSGRALLFVQGRPPRCHRCGDRSHKVAQCTSTLSYANAMRGGTNDDEYYDETETEPTPATQAIVHQSAARAADDSATATATVSEPVAVTETMTTTSTTAISVQTVAESATGSTALAATTAPTTAAETASASAIAMSESDVSDRDGDDEHSDGDGETSTSEEGGSGKDAEGFQQPTVHARRQRRSNKRSAVSVSASDTNGRPKKTKAYQNDPNELDPTRRRQSWSKIPTTRRK